MMILTLLKIGFIKTSMLYAKTIKKSILSMLSSLMG